MQLIGSSVVSKGIKKSRSWTAQASPWSMLSLCPLWHYKSLSWAGELCIESQESGSGGQQPWLDLAQPVVQGSTQGANHSSCPEKLFILQSHGPVAAFRPCPHSRWLRGEAGGTPPRSAAPAAVAVKRSDQRLSRRSQTPTCTCSWGRTTPAACGTLPAQGGECKGTGKATLSKDGCRASEQRSGLPAGRRRRAAVRGCPLPASPGPAGQRSRGVRGVQGLRPASAVLVGSGWCDTGTSHRDPPEDTRDPEWGFVGATLETQRVGSPVPHSRIGNSLWVAFIKAGQNNLVSHTGFPGFSLFSFINSKSAC